MLNVWQGNRSAISYCVITHSRRVQVQNHTHRHAHFHTRTAVAQSSCIFQQESKHLPVVPTTWQTHVHKHKHAAVLYVHFVNDYILYVWMQVHVYECMHLYVTVGESVFGRRAAGRESWAMVALHSVLYNYHSQTRFNTVKARLQGSKAQQPLQHHFSLELASCCAMLASGLVRTNY